jgi:hypothetical protein
MPDKAEFPEYYRVAWPHGGFLFWTQQGWQLCSERSMPIREERRS